jgi:hypothetical protein
MSGFKIMLKALLEFREIYFSKYVVLTMFSKYYFNVNVEQIN